MKAELGQKCRLWRNMTCSMPYEVAERLGIKPGDQIQFVEECGRIEIEKVV